MGEISKKLHRKLASKSGNLPTKDPKRRPGELLPGGYKDMQMLMPELATFHVLFTTPYILIESTKDDWMQFLKRTLLKADGNDDRERLQRLLLWRASFSGDTRHSSHPRFK